MMQAEKPKELEHPSDGGEIVVTLDATGLVVAWSAGARLLTGFTESEIVGEHIAWLYTEDERREGRPAHDLAAAAAGGFEGRCDWVRADGSRFPADVRISPLVGMGGVLAGFAMTFRLGKGPTRSTQRPIPLSIEADWNLPTERPPEDESLADAVLGLISSRVAVLDQTGVILKVNPAWRRFAEASGLSEPSVEGANYFKVLAAFKPDDIAVATEFADGIRDVLAGRRDFYSQESPCNSFGEVQWCLARVYLFEGNGPRRVVVTTDDVTEQNVAKEVLEKDAERLAAYRAFDRAILSSTSTDEVGSTALKHLARFIPFSEGRVVVFENGAGEARVIAPDSMTLRVPLSAENPDELETLREGHVVELENLPAEGSDDVRMATWPTAGLRSLVRIPLLHKGELIGSMDLGSNRLAAFTSEMVETVREVGNQMAIAIRQALSYEHIRTVNGRLEEMSRRLIVAEEDERRWIAREMHDEIGQSLTAIKIHLQGAARNLGDSNEVRSRVEEAATLLDQTLVQLRAISLNLRPSMLDDFGLAAAMRTLLDAQARVGTFAAHFLVVADDPGFRLDPEIETACYRVAQEALTNVVRYASAKEVWVELKLDDRALFVSIRDDGNGFDTEAALSRASGGASLGLLGMRERVRLLGGRFTLHSAPGQGSEITGRFPWKRPTSSGQDAAG